MASRRSKWHVFVWPYLVHNRREIGNRWSCKAGIFGSWDFSLIKGILKFLLHLFIVRIWCTYVTGHLWRSADNLGESALPPPCLSLEIVKLSGLESWWLRNKPPYLLQHLTSLLFLILEFTLSFRGKTPTIYIGPIKAKSTTFSWFWNQTHSVTFLLGRRTSLGCWCLNSSWRSERLCCSQ